MQQASNIEETNSVYHKRSESQFWYPNSGHLSVYLSFCIVDKTRSAPTNNYHLSYHKVVATNFRRGRLKLILDLYGQGYTDAAVVNPTTWQLLFQQKCQQLELLPWNNLFPLTNRFLMHTNPIPHPLHAMDTAAPEDPKMHVKICMARCSINISCTVGCHLSKHFERVFG